MTEVSNKETKKEEERERKRMKEKERERKKRLKKKLRVKDVWSWVSMSTHLHLVPPTLIFHSFFFFDISFFLIFHYFFLWYCILHSSPYQAETTSQAGQPQSIIFIAGLTLMGKKEFSKIFSNHSGRLKNMPFSVITFCNLKAAFLCTQRKSWRWIFKFKSQVFKFN